MLCLDLRIAKAQRYWNVVRSMLDWREDKVDMWKPKSDLLAFRAA